MTGLLGIFSDLLGTLRDVLRVRVREKVCILSGYRCMVVVVNSTGVDLKRTSLFLVLVELSVIFQSSVVRMKPQTVTVIIDGSRVCFSRSRHSSDKGCDRKFQDN